MLAHAVANAAGLGVLAWLARREGRRHGACRERGRSAADARADVLRYARSASALVILDAVVWQRTEVAFLQALAPPAEIAFYALAFGGGRAGQPHSLPGSRSSCSRASRRWSGAAASPSWRGCTRTAMRYLVLLGAPLAVGLAVTAPAVVGVLYGPAYAPAGAVLAVLAIGSLPSFAAGASPAVLHATKRQDRLLRQGDAGGRRRPGPGAGPDPRRRRARRRAGHRHRPGARQPAGDPGRGAHGRRRRAGRRPRCASSSPRWPDGDRRRGADAGARRCGRPGGSRAGSAPPPIRWRCAPCTR